MRPGYKMTEVGVIPEGWVPEFGRGFSEKSIRHVVRFAQVFPDSEIVSTLSRELTWSLLEVIYQTDPLKREFYVEMCPSNASQARTPSL